MNLSQHFSRGEFACRCGCGFDTVDAELLAVLEAARQHFKAPIAISSGCRCVRHNRAVMGSPNSQHVLGRAADITVQGMPPHIVAEHLEKTFPGRYGIGRYSTFTHLDTRNAAARWRG